MFKDFLTKAKNGLRKAMLSPGFDSYNPDEEYEEYEEYEAQPEIPRASYRQVESWQEVAHKATVPKSTRESKYNDKIVELYGHKNKAEATAEVTLASPKDVSASNIITDLIKEGKICAVNLTGVERGQAQRIVDVVAGGVYALDGTITRISKDIFIVAPEGVKVSGEMKEELSRDYSWAFAR